MTELSTQKRHHLMGEDSGGSGTLLALVAALVSRLIRLPQQPPRLLLRLTPRWSLTQQATLGS